MGTCRKIIAVFLYRIGGSDAVLIRIASPSAQADLIILSQAHIVPVGHPVIFIPHQTAYIQILIILVQLIQPYHQDHLFLIILSGTGYILDRIAGK